MRSPTQSELTHIILFVAGTQILAILAYWIASNVVSKERAKFLNAINVWLTYLGTAVGIGVVVYGMAYLRVSERQALLVTLGLGLFALVVLFAAPMKIYDFTFPRALGFLLVSLILITAGETVAMRFLPESLPLAQRSKAFIELATHSNASRMLLVNRLMKSSTTRNTFAQSDAIAADRSRPLPERHAALQEMYRELAARRTHLRQNDVAGLAAYQRDQTRYELLLVQLQSDAAAAPR